MEESDSKSLAKEESKSRDSADVVNKAIKRNMNRKRETVETEEPNNEVEESDLNSNIGDDLASLKKVLRTFNVEESDTSVDEGGLKFDNGKEEVEWWHEKKVDSNAESVETDHDHALSNKEESDSSGDEGGIKLADLSDDEFA